MEKDAFKADKCLNEQQDEDAGLLSPPAKKQRIRRQRLNEHGEGMRHLEEPVRDLVEVSDDEKNGEEEFEARPKDGLAGPGRQKYSRNFRQRAPHGGGEASGPYAGGGEGDENADFARRAFDGYANGRPAEDFHGGNRHSNGGGHNGADRDGGKNYNNYKQRSDEFNINQRLRNLSGPTLDLAPIESQEELKFSGRNRLYIGNLPTDMQNKLALHELFKPYGELSDVFLGPDGKFAFAKMDYRANAEKAKNALDGSTIRGRQLRVRFAPSATAVRVKNLTPFVSNELLYRAFEIFGPVERAYILVDDRGNHMGEGIVEFARKVFANVCVRQCTEKCFFLTASLRPCVVEFKELVEETNGYPEKNITKNSQFNAARSQGPRFAEPNSFEHDYGTRWMELHREYKAKSEALKRDMKIEEENLQAQLEVIRYERETEALREELRKREADNARLRLQWEMRQKQLMQRNMLNEESFHSGQNLHSTPNCFEEQDVPFRRRQQERGAYRSGKRIDFPEYADINHDMDDSPFEVFHEAINDNTRTNRMPQSPFHLNFGEDMPSMPNMDRERI